MNIAFIMKGSFVIVLDSQLALAANEISARSDHIVTRFYGTETRLEPTQILKIYSTDADLEFPVDPGILSTISNLERLIDLYEETGAHVGSYTICEASSLALTILPDRSTQDVDVITGEPIFEFIESTQQIHWDTELEFIDDSVLSLMGNWRKRSSTAIGINGRKFGLMHPLDTVMQKMLRWDCEKFEAKDLPDIEAIISKLNPTRETLRLLLSENPFRYAKASGPLSIATDAIERNTRLFLETHLPGVTYEGLIADAADRYSATLQKSNLGPSLNKISDVDLKSKIKSARLDME